MPGRPDLLSSRERLGSTDLLECCLRWRAAPILRNRTAGRQPRRTRYQRGYPGRFPPGTAHSGWSGSTRSRRRRRWLSRMEDRINTIQIARPDLSDQSNLLELWSDVGLTYE